MNDLVLLVVTGLGLGALYFLAASGLSLIYGLMGVLNFAHGAFMMAGSYAGWTTMSALPPSMSAGARLAAAALVALAVGALVGLVVEVVLIRPLYRRHIQQVLVTVGLSLAAVAAAQGIWGADPRPLERPLWLTQTTSVGDVRLPNDRFLYIGAAVLLFAVLLAVLRLTRLGLVIRAGVENRTMVEALGIDVHRTFTVVFAIGGAAAALAGLLYSTYAGTVSPAQGGSLLIYAFIVVVIGGMGSLVGTAVAAVAVGLVQQLANYYAASGIGDLSVVLLLAIVVAAFLGGLGGVVHAIVLGGSNPHVTTTEFTLALLVMVVLGGLGSTWGALIGGFVYHYADARLVELSGTGILSSLPEALRLVLAQPLFLLGLLFVIVVYFAPTGLTGLGRRILRRSTPA